VSTDMRFTSWPVDDCDVVGVDDVFDVFEVVVVDDVDVQDIVKDFW